MENMNLEQNTIASTSVLDILKNPKIGADELPSIVEKIESTPLVEFPPKLCQMPCKPIFLDLGFSYL